MPYIKRVLTTTLSIDIISMDIMALSQLYLDSAPMAHSQLVQGVGEGGGAALLYSWSCRRIHVHAIRNLSFVRIFEWEEMCKH